MPKTYKLEQKLPYYAFWFENEMWRMSDLTESDGVRTLLVAHDVYSHCDGWSVTLQEIDGAWRCVEDEVASMFTVRSQTAALEAFVAEHGLPDGLFNNETAPTTNRVIRHGDVMIEVPTVDGASVHIRDRDSDGALVTHLEVSGMFVFAFLEEQRIEIHERAVLIALAPDWDEWNLPLLVAMNTDQMIGLIGCDSDDVIAEGLGAVLCDSDVT